MLHTLLIAVALALQGQTVLPKKHVGAKAEPGKVVAKVNGQDITAGELDGFVWDWAAAAALEDLIMYKLIADEATRAGIKVDEAEIDAEFTKQFEAYKAQLPAGKTPEEALAERHYSKSRLYLGLRREILITKLAEKEFTPAHYVKVSTISVKPASEQTDALAAAIAKMAKVYERLKNGDKWDVVLRTVTQEESVVRTNGLIGWRGLGAFPETVQAEIKTLKVGGITKPAQTPYGIQVFRIEAKGETLKPDELAELKGQFLNAARVELINRLRRDAKIERFIGR